MFHICMKLTSRIVTLIRNGVVIEIVGHPLNKKQTNKRKKNPTTTKGMKLLIEHKHLNLSHSIPCNDISYPQQLFEVD